MKTIKQVCDITNISKRALHHYDKIGLLCAKRSENGYRYYDDEDLKKLKQILLFKEMDFALNDIKTFLSAENFDYKKALALHKNLLLAKRNRLNGIIDTIDKEIKGENDMSFKEFDISEVEKAKQVYEKEVRKKWGDTHAYKQSKQKTAKYSKQDWQKIQNEADLIFEGFSKIEDIESEDAKRLVLDWQEHITKNYYDCTDEILCGLAQMYVNDVRFKENIDKFGEGTAVKMSEAILFHCK